MQQTHTFRPQGPSKSSPAPAARALPPRHLAPALAVALLCIHGLHNPADAANNVALAPLETLGAQSKVSRATANTISRAIARVPGVALVPDRRVARAIDKKPALRTCDGNPGCLAEFGRDVGARYVVYGEVGGLGDVELVYLEVIDVATGKELRSTTLELSGAKSRERARAAAVLLLAPERYLGRLAVSVDIAGASIYVDGTRVARSPSKPLALSVGTHALRVTHPEFHDFVRFVDIAFDAETAVPVELQKFPIVTSDMARDGELAGATNIIYRGVEPTPWYRRWYTVAGFGTAVLITSAILVGVLADGIDADRVIDVDEPR